MSRRATAPFTLSGAEGAVEGSLPFTVVTLRLRCAPLRVSGFLAMLLLAGCSAAPPSAPLDPGTGCDSASIRRVLPTTALHVSDCTQACGNGENPPTGGNHC